MQFGLYLKKKGIITAEELLAALEEQHCRLTSIGQLAMEEGVLSARDVFTVLRCQRGLPHELFGEVAVDMGLMRRTDLNRLLAHQWDRKPQLADVLVRQGVLSPARAEEELAAFHREMERREAVITRCISSSPHRTTTSPTMDRSETEAMALLV